MAITLGGGPYYHKGGIPVAVSMWFKTTSTVLNIAIASQCDTGTSRNGWNIILNNPTSGRILLLAKDGSGNTIGTATASSVGFNDGNWHHLAANFRFTNGSLSEVYFDGAKVINDTATGAWTPSGATDWTAGKSDDSFWGTFPGSLADIAGFKALLSQDQVTALAKGFSAQRVIPGQLLNSWIPVIRHTPSQNEYDDKTGTPFAGGATLSNAGAESYAEHPRIYF